MTDKPRHFKISSFNCNGIGNFSKRKDVFDYLRKLKHDIYFLQECHLLERDENFVRSQWGYNCFVSGNSTNKKGVCILLNNSFEYKLHSTIKDPEGCYLILDISFLNKKFTLCNIYGPSEGDRPDFFRNIQTMIEQIGNEEIVIGGDFNIILNPNLDMRNYRNHMYKPNSRREVKNVMSNLDLIDIFREIHPEKRQFTWKRTNSTQQGRLDFFLISETLLADTKGANIHSGYRSDHSMITLEFQRETSVRQRQFWKFNNSLLKDKDYIALIKKIILDVKKQYAIIIYDQDNIENVSDELIEFSISDQLFLETLLMEIRGKTISYSSFKKKTEMREENNLISEIQDLEDRFDQLDAIQVQSLENKKEQLINLRNNKLQGMIIRSRIKWINEGEKPTSYFCNLEKRNFISKNINFLEINDGKIIYENEEIVNETRNYYQNLYEEREVQNINLETIINNPVKLSDNEKEKLEGKLSYTELHSALKEMKNNKSPGSDGFTSEFFKFFFKDLGYFILRSINFGFVNGLLSITQRQGVITCIPKENKPKQYLKNWRPISLLNTTYKLATACIANRLKNVLHKLVHSDQRGFMTGRYIGENVRLIYDILSYTDTHNIPGLLLFIDFEKAFDSIAWSFIVKVLKFLNFGNDFIGWIKLFYTDVKSCVSVNGTYSSWFSIGRGVRQGDPLSPYLYLLCAEMLSDMIRENNNIKGLKLRNEISLISQFADDTALSLDGSEQSFVEAIHTLNIFADISGLKINIEKTQIVWLGNQRGRGLRYMRDKNFIWDPGTFRYLGIIFSVQVGDIVRLNYDSKLEEIKKTLKIWQKRQLTPFGKITIIKTLGISKLTYLFSNIPDPSVGFLKELEKIFFDFLWSEKYSKLNRKCTYKPTLEGGLNMLNVYSFLSAMKINWVKRMLREDSSYKKFVVDLYPRFHNISYLGAEYCKVLCDNMKNYFWFDVFKHLHKFVLKCKPNDMNELLSECLFYNNNITVGGHVVYIRDWVERGIFQIFHLVDQNGNLLTYNEFLNRNANIQTNFLTFQGLIQSVRMYIRKINFTPTSPGEADIQLAIKYLYNGSRFVRMFLDKNDNVPPGQTKWNLQFNNLNWLNIYRLCHKTSIECQLRWLQLRILLRVLPTNRYLYLRNITDNASCTFCQNEEETIVHFFWHCPIVNQFWKDLLQNLINTCDHIHNLTLTLELVLFGTKENVVTDSVFDYILLLAKQYIYSCKWKETREVPNVLVFKRLLRIRYKIEKYRHTNNSNNNQNKFDVNWFPYQRFIE